MVDTKGGLSIPRNNIKDVCGIPPRTISPSGEGCLDTDVGVLLCGLIQTLPHKGLKLSEYMQ